MSFRYIPPRPLSRSRPDGFWVRAGLSHVEGLRLAYFNSQKVRRCVCLYTSTSAEGVCRWRGIPRPNLCACLPPHPSRKSFEARHLPRVCLHTRGFLLDRPLREQRADSCVTFKASVRPAKGCLMVFAGHPPPTAVSASWARSQATAGAVANQVVPQSRIGKLNRCGGIPADRRTRRMPAYRYTPKVECGGIPALRRLFRT